MKWRAVRAALGDVPVLTRVISSGPDWSGVGDAIARHAPGLGQLVAGRAGAAIGAAVAAGIGVAATPAAVLERVSQDPEIEAKLRMIESVVIAAHLADVSHAREMHKGHPMTWVLPLLLIAVWLVMVWAMIDGRVASDSRDQFYYAFGNWTTATLGGIAYWVGTSRTSAERASDIVRISARSG